ncbi:MAG: hypothetical protein WD648_08295, partial [Planctomycetaceae bacterium]
MLSPWNYFLAASFLAVSVVPTLSAQDPAPPTQQPVEAPKDVPAPLAIALPHAAKGSEQVAMIDRSKVDPDFAFQGEFHGTV